MVETSDSPLFDSISASFKDPGVFIFCNWKDCPICADLDVKKANIYAREKLGLSLEGVGS